MTALKEFDRLECPGVWRASSSAQRLDVVVSVGDATLVLSDRNDSALAHWSLPAVERINPGERPAQFRPGPDATETLELSDKTMIVAIARVQSAISKRRPHPGRLRSRLVSSLFLVVALIMIFWLPRAMITYTASVVPAAKRADIGDALLVNISRVAGLPCDTEQGQIANKALHRRLFGEATGRLVILSGGVPQAQHLPGNIILLNRGLVEDYDDPRVAAGYALVQDVHRHQVDPLARLLTSVGLIPSFRLLTTGNIPQTALSTYAENLLIKSPARPSDQAILNRLNAAGISAAPYAYAIDLTGETTIGLIEADPVTGPDDQQLLTDENWISLQAICGE